jgi:hypothetical protein
LFNLGEGNMDREVIASSFGEVSDTMATQFWKIAPFKPGNRMWLNVVIQGYSFVLGSCIILSCVLNSVEGEDWIRRSVRGNQGPTAKGDTALDECFWFVVTTVHSIGFGEFMARGVASRIIAMTCVTLGYWFPLFLLSIILLSNLPGERLPSLMSVTSRMIGAVWPSYAVFLCITVCIGATMGPYVSDDPYGRNEWPTGVYYFWTVVHRMPYGDIYPDTPYGRSMTIFAAFMGVIYMPYALALVAIRCPTLEQHESLLGSLRKFPELALGRGYVAPAGAMREVVMEEYSPGHSNI